MWADQRPTTGETGKFDDGFTFAGRGIDQHYAAGSRFENPQMTVVPAWGVGHRKTVSYEFAAGNVKDNAAVRLRGAPATRRVGLAKGSGECRPPVTNRQTVQVTAIFRRQRRDERRPPPRHEAIVFVESCKA